MFTVKEFAARLRISPSLVYQECKAGKIRHERYGQGRGAIRIPEEALEEYRKACRVQQQASVPVLKHLKV